MRKKSTSKAYLITAYFAGGNILEASRYRESPKEKENICLFCGEPVEYGWARDYKGTRVWVCRKCVLEGEIGSLMASAILDKDKLDRETLEEINRCLETTQMSLYRNVLHYTFKYPSGLRKLGEGVKEKIDAVASKEPQTEGSLEIENREFESRIESRQKSKDKLDEDQLLKYLEDWRSIRDIQQRFKIGYKPLLEKLDELYQKGMVDKRKVKIETGGHKYKYKKISGETINNEDGKENEGNENLGTVNPAQNNTTYKMEADEVIDSSEGVAVVASEFPDEDQLLRYLEDWRSVRDIQQQFNVRYKTLQESLNRLFFRGYLLKKTIPDNPMFKRAVSARRA